jgi:YidC/Oxa1 family membrane protein insertase
MDKNTIIAIVLSTLVIVAGFSVQSIFFPSQPVKQPQQTAIAAPQNDQTSSNSSTASTTTVSAPVQAMLETPQTESLVEEKSVVETDLVRVEFTNKGGDVVSYKLKKHADKNGSIEMAEFTSEDNRAFSLILGDAHGSVVNQLFNVKKISDTEIGFYRTFTVKNADGTDSSFTLVKQYTFLPNDYMFELKVTVDGDPSLAGLKFGNAAYTLRTSPEIGPKWNQKQDQYEYRRFYHLLNGKKKTVNLSAGQTKDVSDKVTWSGVAGKYFTLIALPETSPQSVLYSAQASNADAPGSQIFLTRSPITGNKNTDVWRFYVGPRTENFLSKYNVATNNPYKLSNTNLDQIVESSGILAPLEILLKWIMELFYYVIPNWGVSIILLTILMRIIIFPLTKKSSEATLRMQELQPQIQEIQQKYKNNSQKMNEEMAKFYQSVGYNPLSGCLPLLIQFPLIFAMYNLFNNYFEFRGAMFIPGWIPDLSQGDSVLAFAFKIPLLGWSDLRVLPIIYVASQILSGLVTQTPGNNQQNGTMKFMMFGMPLIFFFLFYNAPSGLILYWTLSNILMLGQQLLINRMMHKRKASGLKLVKK